MGKERIPKIIKLTLAYDKTKVSHFTEYDFAFSYGSEEVALTLVSSKLQHFVSGSIGLLCLFHSICKCTNELS